MFFKELTAADIPDTFLSEAKAQARVTTSSEDALIELYLASALQSVEQYTGRALIERQFLLVLDDFPCGGEIEIPIGGLTAVDSVQYRDTDGVLQTWDDANYTVGTVRPLGCIVRGLGVPWPTIQLSVAEAVQITFTAGYGVDEADLPPNLRHAILLLAAHFYDTRSPVNVGNIVSEIPMTLRFAFDPFVIPNV